MAVIFKELLATPYTCGDVYSLSIDQRQPAGETMIYSVLTHVSGLNYTLCVLAPDRWRAIIK